MGTTSRILIPSILIFLLCLIPLSSFRPFKNSISVLFNLQTPIALQNIHLTETKTYTLSSNPLVIYITNFITPLEATQLVALSEKKFRPSPLYADDGTLQHDTTYRSSLTATLPPSPIIKDLEARARSFSFYSSGTAVGEKKIKPMVVQKYGLGNQYKDHYDWFLPHPSLTGNIESTFFVYINANCTGGGTNFPRLRMQPITSRMRDSAGIVRGGKENEWCEFVDCDRPYDKGVTFKPITGNAIFWRNTDGNGGGFPNTLHAGMPVTSGEKMGLNIWTWMDY